MELNQSVCVHVLEQRGPSNDKYCIHYWEVWTKEKTLIRETRCGGQITVSSGLEEWQLKVPKWPRSLECRFPLLVILGFDHMFPVTPKMFSSGFRVGKWGLYWGKLWPFLWRAVIAYGLIMELLTLQLYVPDSGCGCEGSSKGLRRVLFCFFYDWDCFHTEWY